MKHITFQDRAALTQSPLAKKLFLLMTEKKTCLSLSIDVTRSEDLLNYADKLGDEICILKTHIDILEDFSSAIIEKLQSLAKKHQFLLFEDRKFADIGHTVLHQYTGGVYKIAHWADLVNAHVLPGPGIIDGLYEGAKKIHTERGLLLLAEMSSKGHLMDKTYIKLTQKMAENYPHFITGFITQHAFENSPQWVYLTPGVSIENKSDGLKQQYVTPEEAIIQNGCDVIIVGRGILSHKDPLLAAKNYRMRAWQAYENRTE